MTDVMAMRKILKLIMGLLLICVLSGGGLTRAASKCDDVQNEALVYGFIDLSDREVPTGKPKLLKNWQVCINQRGYQNRYTSPGIEYDILEI